MKTQAICAEPIIEGVAVTKDREKVTCKYCLGALAVTTLIPAVSPPTKEQAPAEVD